MNGQQNYAPLPPWVQGRQWDFPPRGRGWGRGRGWRPQRLRYQIIQQVPVQQPADSQKKKNPDKSGSASEVLPGIHVFQGRYYMNTWGRTKKDIVGGMATALGNPDGYETKVD